MAEKKILAITAFAKALIDVTTEVDDDEDPQDAIKEYGKELTRSLTTRGVFLTHDLSINFCYCQVLDHLWYCGGIQDCQDGEEGMEKPES